MAPSKITSCRGHNLHQPDCARMGTCIRNEGALLANGGEQPVHAQFECFALFSQLRLEQDRESDGECVELSGTCQGQDGSRAPPFGVGQHGQLTKVARERALEPSPLPTKSGNPPERVQLLGPLESTGPLQLLEHGGV